MKKFILLGIFASLFFAGCTSQPTNNKNLDEFAQCLTNNGAIMYGAISCPHCQTQKAMFGESFTYVTYVECTKDTERCADLKGVPTWKFKDGSQLGGLQEFNTLAQKTNCTLSQ